MRTFYEQQRDIYRLKIPFDNLYTSVFLIRMPEGFVLVDCATTERDVDEYIVPALKSIGIGLDDVTRVVVTHNHSDHAGGLARIMELAPRIEAVRDERELGALVRTCCLPGHTEDFIGVLDLRSHTLITGDALQGAGVGKYRCTLADKQAYRETLDKIRKDDRIKNLMYSHAYEPWYDDKILGRDRVIDALAECERYI